MSNDTSAQRGYGVIRGLYILRQEQPEPDYTRLNNVCDPPVTLGVTYIDPLSLISGPCR